MNNDLESRRRKSYTQMRMIYDLTMAGLMIGMSFILFFGDKFGLDLIAGLDSLMRYGFGTLCLLYGGFRMYRGLKHNY